MHWVLNDGTESPLFNSHPDNPSLMKQKNSPERPAMLGSDRVTKVAFAVKLEPCIGDLDPER